MTLKKLGESKDGNPSQGELTMSDGEKYVGEHKDVKRNGQGTQTLPDGRKEAFTPSKSAYEHLCPIITCD